MEELLMLDDRIFNKKLYGDPSDGEKDDRDKSTED